MQALAALAHAHSMGVVHRDLKPANLMITETGAVKIMDFGIARVAGTEHLTNAGFMMGTPAYMSPEQVRGEEIDARADLYAMGVVFYRLTTGEAAVQGRHAVRDGAVAGERSADAGRARPLRSAAVGRDGRRARARQGAGGAVSVGRRVPRSVRALPRRIAAHDGLWLDGVWIDGADRDPRDAAASVAYRVAVDAGSGNGRRVDAIGRGGCVTGHVARHRVGGPAYADGNAAGGCCARRRARSDRERARQARRIDEEERRRPGRCRRRGDDRHRRDRRHGVVPVAPGRDATASGSSDLGAYSACDRSAARARAASGDAGRSASRHGSTGHTRDPGHRRGSVALILARRNEAGLRHATASRHHGTAGASGHDSWSHGPCLEPRARHPPDRRAHRRHRLRRRRSSPSTT